MAENIVTGPLTEDEEENSNIVSGPLKAQEEKEEAEEEEESEEGENFKEFKEVSSSMVAEVAFDEESQSLEVVFVNGHEESYTCDKPTFESLLEAPSIGQFMHEQFLSN